MAYIFLDESGDLGFDFSKHRTTKFFVVYPIYACEELKIEKLLYAQELKYGLSMSKIKRPVRKPKFGDKIEAHFTTSKIKRVSFDVIIRFFNKRSKQIVCETQHTLVFVDSRTDQFTDIPKLIKTAVLKYQEVP